MLNKLTTNKLIVASMIYMEKLRQVDLDADNIDTVWTEINSQLDDFNYWIRQKLLLDLYIFYPDWYF